MNERSATNSRSQRASRFAASDGMVQKRVRLTLLILVLSVFAIASSLLLLRAVDTAIVFYVIGFVLLLIVLDPFIGLICYLVFFYVRPNEIIPALAGSQIFLITLSGAFASMVIRLAVKRRAFGLMRAPQDYALLWFVLAILLSHLFHLNATNAAVSVWSFVPTLVFYVLITNLVTDEKRLRVFVSALVISTVFVGVQALVQRYYGFGIVGLTPPFPERLLGSARVILTQRRLFATGVAEDPNIFGLMLLVSLPFVYFRLVTERRILLRFVALLSIVFIVGLIYMTNSRGAFLSLGVLVAAGFMRRFGPVVGVVLGGAAIAGAVLFGPSRMGEITPTGEGRFGLWATGFQLFGSSPIFGIGKGAWGEEYNFMVAHNSFIHCAAELGLFGLIPWVLMIYVSIKNAMYVSRHAVGKEFGPLGGHASAICWGLVAFALPAMFLSEAYSYLLFLLAALSVAVVNVFVRMSGRRYQLFERKDLVYTGIIAFGGLVALRLYLLATGW